MTDNPYRTDPPVCGDPHHRHAGRCEIWAKKIVPREVPSAGEMMAWLRAQVEADKAAAEAVGDGRWEQAAQRLDDELGWPEINEHMHRSSPLDKIADCDAKLRLLDEYDARNNDVKLMLGPSCERQRQWSGLSLAVRVLASGYRHRDGWREEWAA